MSLAEDKLFKYIDPFKLESGEVLPRFQLQYRTLGKVNADKDNIVWVCHALTANAEVDDWWEGLVGKGRLYDPEKHFIICANLLGSCYGSTGPLDTNPDTQDLYLLDFPQFTTRDMVFALDELRKELGFNKIHTVIGGSMGGMQAMEWAIIQPEVFENLILLATNARHSPWGIAFNEAQRMAIESDPTWKDHSPEAGKKGMAAARSMALLSYRNYEAYWNTQNETDIEKKDHYRAASYQRYQGEKIIQRFNCQSYYFLSKAMDSHHVGRGRGGVEKAFENIKANTLVIGISSDQLFPVSEQKFIAENIDGAFYHEIDSFYGHDGFLIETVEIHDLILDFFKQKNVNWS